MAIRKIRTRFYFAVEGEGEQAFVKLLQNFCDRNGLHVHLDPKILSGGGYKTMLQQAVKYRQRDKKVKSAAKASILLVDGDRAQCRDDGWDLSKLIEEAQKENFQVCIQNPNQEGLLFRMLPGNEKKKPNPTKTIQQLKKAWPTYQKPVDFQTLFSKFTLDDLLRVSTVDTDIEMVLKIIGFK